jgi:hypothetical protein
MTALAQALNVDDRLEIVRTHHAEAQNALPSLVKPACTRRADGVQV